MKLGTRSRIAIATAVLATGTLVGPAGSAMATYPYCTPGHCDTVVQYFSDATKSHIVGEYGGEVCPFAGWGVETQYMRRITIYC